MSARRFGAPRRLGTLALFQPLQDLVEAGRFAVGRVVEALSGEPHGRDANAQVLGVAFAVRLERPAILVEVPPIELDDQPVLTEIDIGPTGLAVDVDLRGWEVVLDDEGAEGILKLGVGRVGMVLGERPQELGAGVQRVAGDDVGERVGAQAALAALVVDQPGSARVWETAPGRSATTTY
jgi:hypothetical protein